MKITYLIGALFGAKIYPSMIIFNPAGEEVTRLHAGIDISAYNSVLELSLDRWQMHIITGVSCTLHRR